jgi:hypothetical protein
MSYDHKIIDLKFNLKGLVNQNVCSKLINFFEDNKHMTIPEKSYKYPENEIQEDNCMFLNISELRTRPEFVDPYQTILKYLRIVLTQYETYMRTILCPVYKNTFMTHTNNIRIIKYGVGQLIKDHSDVD